ncbi:MAG: glycosyltransferase, partial [Desulfacinum sp.]|nr:glycosyltransferase [Desulfacinum sp.]
DELKLRIAYIAYLGFPSNTAGSLNVARACSAMGEMGHEVLLLVPSRHPLKLDTVTNCFSHYGVPPTFSVQPLPAWQGLGGRHYFSWRCLMKLHGFRPDLVICRYLPSARYTCLAGFNTVCELHSPIKKKRKHIQRLLNSAHLKLFVTVSHRLRHHYLAQDLPGLSPDRIVALPTGRAPLEQTPPPAPLPKTTRGWNIGYVGKLQHQKGLAVVRDLARRLPHHDFHIIGGDEESVSSWRSQMPGGNVHFHGYIPPARVPSYIEAMDICLLPNQPHSANPSDTLYTSPMKAFDYMAQGKAIFASDYPEIREILSEDTSVLLPPQDTDAWVHAIESARKEDLLSIGRAAKEFFMNNLTIQSKYRRIIERSAR